MKYVKLLPLLLIAVLAVSALGLRLSGGAQAEALSEDSEEIAVLLADGASSCADGSVLIDGDTVTVTAAGDYRLSGSLSDGQILVDAPEDAKVRLILDNVSIISKNSAAIYARNADKLVLSSAAGSENFLQAAGSFVQTDENKVDAAVFSKCDLTLSGEGVMNISSLSGHAVVSKDDLKLKSGTVNLEAAGKGLSGKDSVLVEGGVLNADVGGDALCSDSDAEGRGTITVSGGVLNLLCQKDGLDAAGALTVSGGVLTLNAGSGQAGKGLVSDADIVLSGGTLSVSAVDDAVHAGGSVYLTGGALTLSSGDDGVHADKELLIEAGSVYVEQSYEGLEAQVVTVTGGDVRVNARDDGVNAAGGNDGSNNNGFFGGDPFAADADAALNISGGTLVINAEGDGLDSNGSLNVSGGLVLVSGPVSGANGALDYGLEANISGGTVIAAGSSAMAENFGRGSTQGSVLLNLSSVQAAGSTVSVTDENGTVLASFQPEKSYNSVVVSTEGMVLGGTYTVSAGTETQNVTLSELVLGGGIGMGGGMNGFGMGLGRFGGQSFPNQDSAAGGFGGMTPPEQSGESNGFGGMTPPEQNGESKGFGGMTMPGQGGGFGGAFPGQGGSGGFGGMTPPDQSGQQIGYGAPAQP